MRKLLVCLLLTLSNSAFAEFGFNNFEIVASAVSGEANGYETNGSGFGLKHIQEVDKRYYFETTANYDRYQFDQRGVRENIGITAFGFNFGKYSKPVNEYRLYGQVGSFIQYADPNSLDNNEDSGWDLGTEINVGVITQFSKFFYGKVSSLYRNVHYEEEPLIDRESDGQHGAEVELSFNYGEDASVAGAFSRIENANKIEFVFRKHYQ